jgi:hypothetical protein
MQRRRFCLAALAGSAAAWLPAQARASGDVAIYAGIFALSGKKPKARAKLFVRSRSATGVTLLFTFNGLDGKQLSRFDVAMTKRMHVIVISDDFRTFEHLHAEPNAEGLFSVAATLSAQGGGCQIYADTVPHGLGQQVFRFPVAFGSAKAAAPDLTPTPRTVRAGPYAVTLGSLTLNAGSSTLLSVHIAKHGTPATDLHPYLGGAAHAVFINAKTLAYTHVHPEAAPMAMAMPGADMPMDMGDPAELAPNAKVDPAMVLHVVAPVPGRYKLWLQFRGGDALYVSPFVLTAA